MRPGWLSHVRAGTIAALVLLLGTGAARGGGLDRSFDRKYGQVEVGGRFAGVEFHRSRPLPSRISFYAPVANSIDLSTDYWKRDESRPMTVAVRMGSAPARWIGRDPWAYTLAPHRVKFSGREGGLVFTMAYEFCFREPALVYTLTVRNDSTAAIPVELYTHLKPTLRTCQTYARVDSAWTDVDSVRSALMMHFDDPGTDRAAVVVQNVGWQPSSWTTRAAELAPTDSGTSGWVAGPSPLQRGLLASPGNALAAFVYAKNLRPGDSLVVVQAIGSCRGSDAGSLVKRLHTLWRSEVDAYDRYVLGKAFLEAQTVTGNQWLDRSAEWARAILAANAHEIDGTIVPMPCPAEYNFFFTHDVLMTDLAAVNFDRERVKRDLEYIAAHARDSIIPHAYYWRDDSFKTEYCTPENWNHFWFIMIAARYLRHTLDHETIHALFPLIEKSVTEMLLQHGDDGLMHAAAPDWWDIGHREGPRAYNTILAIRALREFLYLASVEKRDLPLLPAYERLADAMQQSLENRLWDDGKGYLMNFNGSVEDYHYYMGSMLGAAFGLLSPDHARRLVETATRVLVDPRIGARTVMPPDFNTDSVRTFFKFVDNEAGDPYLYANGAVWAHDNAWYALALQSSGSPGDALRFVRATMSLDGIINSPMGQPAMYECRFSDPASPQFGWIDKPNFLWAGGFYLYALYNLLGVRDNEWNLSIAQSVPTEFDSVSYSFEAGGRSLVKQRRAAHWSFLADGRSMPSCVIPLSLQGTRHWDVALGKAEEPMLESVNAIVHAVRVLKGLQALAVDISSFDGHATILRVSAPHAVKHATVDGRPVLPEIAPGDEQDVRSTLRFAGAAGIQHIIMAF